MEAVLSLRDRLSGPLGRATRSVENHQETFRRVNIAMAGAATVLGGALQSAIDRTGVGYEGIEDRVDDLAGATAGGTSLTKADALNAFNTLLILTGGVDRAAPGPAMGPALPAVNIEINLPDSSLLVIDNEATIRRFASEITARVRDDLRRQHSIDTR